MRTKGILAILFLFGFFSGYGQYLENPSVEGTILMIGPPPFWEICIDGSTPNVQPGKYAVYLPPSEGITYVGMLTRSNNTWEDMHSELSVPLSKDSCYIFKIDLAFWENLSFTIVEPVVLKIYGASSVCNKTNLIWQSPPISNEDWLTYEFMIYGQDFDITDIILEAYFAETFPYYGYVLLDNIRISPTPAVDIGNDTTLTLCANDSIILDAGSGFTNYLWQDGSTNSTFTVTGAGTYWVQVSNSYGCTASDTVEISLEEYIEMETLMIDSIPVCANQEIILWVNVINGVAPYSYEWTGLSDTTSSVTISTDTTVFFHVLITDDCGNLIEDSIKVIVLPGPDIDLGSDTLICIDDTYTLHAGPGYPSYLWQDGSQDSTLTIDQPGTYWVQVTSSVGCVSSDTIQIQLFPAIQMDIGSDTTLCEGDSLNLNAGNGFISYLWQDNSTDSTFLVNTSGIYWVTVVNNNGCEKTDSIAVDFISNPEFTLGEDEILCEGEELILNPGAGYISYLWQNGETTQYFTVTESGYYSVTVNNGCGAASDTIFVQVFPAPEPDLGPDTTICMGEALILEPGSFSSYLWQDNSTLYLYTVTGSGIYSVEVENSFGCAASDEIFVDVSDPQVNLGEDSFLCEGQHIILDAGPGFVSYLWMPDNSTNQTLVVIAEQTYSVTVVDGFGCDATDEVLISLYPFPSADLGGDKEICTGDTLVLAGPPGDFTYYWNGQPGGQNYTVYDAGYYTLSVVNLCDSVSDGIEVTETPVPEVYLGLDAVIVPGQSIELNAGAGYDNYIWQDPFANGSTYTVSESTFDNYGPNFYVEVWEGMCKNSDTIYIELFQVWVPNVITPNGDEYNNLFQPDPEKWQAVKKHKMTVFNRWGKVVWESEDFPSGWDGKQNGKYVAEGSYFWILDAYYGNDNIKRTFKGSLTVLGTSK